MLNDRRSHGLWERTAPPPPRTEKLACDMVADVAIVGAGYTGLSTALHLAERGFGVAVLEAVEIYNGRGIAPGTVYGRELARHIAGDATLDGMVLPVTAPRAAPFRALREGYYEVGSQIAHPPPAH